MVQPLFEYILQSSCMTLAGCLPFGLLSGCLFKALQINVSGTQGEETRLQYLARVECLRSLSLALLR